METSEAIMVGRALFELGRLIERAVRAPQEVTDEDIDAAFDRATQADARWAALLPAIDGEQIAGVIEQTDTNLPGDDEDK